MSEQNDFFYYVRSLEEAVKAVEKNKEDRFLVAKNKHRYVNFTDPVQRLKDSMALDTFKPDEIQDLGDGEYWVAVFYNGDNYLFIPIIPNWISIKEQKEWVSGFHFAMQDAEGDYGWEEKCREFLGSKYVWFRDLAFDRKITYKTEDGELLSTSGVPEDDDFLEMFSSWRDRDKTFAPVISLLDGMTEDETLIAKRAYELLKTAFAELKDEYGDLTEEEEKALAYAFMAGKTAKTLSGYKNRAIAKKGQKFQAQQRGRSTGSLNKLNAWQKKALQIKKENPTFDAGKILDLLAPDDNSGLVTVTENEDHTLPLYRFDEEKEGIKRNNATQKINRFLKDRGHGKKD